MLGTGRTLGMRESNQALAELKTKLEFALSRLNDQDTQRTGVEEIREFLLTLYPDWFPMVINCIGEAGTNLKPLGRCESVKLLGLLAELHGDTVVPLLPRILQVVLNRLQDADLHLREACAETVFRIARSLVLEVDGSSVFATLLKPLFGALGEHVKWVQIGAASCICSVIQGSPSSVLREHLGRLCARLVQHLGLPLAMAKPQLLSACVYAMQAVESVDFDSVLPGLMPCLESCLNASADWQTRKQAIEVLQAIGENPELGQALDLPLPANFNLSAGPTPLQRRIGQTLMALKDDKVRAVREASREVLALWGLPAGKALAAPPPSSAVRSSSPSTGADWQEQRGQAPKQQTLERPVGSNLSVRSSSPTPGAAWVGEQAGVRDAGGGPGSAGGLGVRQARSAQPKGMMRNPMDTLDDSCLVPERPGSMAMDPDEREMREAEKAVRKNAVNAVLQNADLSLTKKPRPKRERVSIFDGPANSNFFNPVASGGGIIEIDPPDPGYLLEEESPASRSFEEEPAHPAKQERSPQSDGAAGGADALGTEDTPTTEASDEEDDVGARSESVPLPEELQGGFSAAGEGSPLRDEQDVAGGDVLGGFHEAPPRRPPSAAEVGLQAGPAAAGEGRAWDWGAARRPPESQAEELLNYSEEEVSPESSKTGHNAHSPFGEGFDYGERPGAAESRNRGVAPGGWPHAPAVAPLALRQDADGEQSPVAGTSPAASSSRRPQQAVAAALPAALPAAAARDDAQDAWDWEEQPVDSGPSKRGAVQAWEEAEGGQRGGMPTRLAHDDQPVVMAQETREELDFQMSQLKLFAERLQDLEEEKQRDEDLLKDRIQILSRTCESQSHTLAMQQDQLQAQERRLLALEKQNKLQEQRIKNQEYQLEEQAQRLEQQDDLLSQHTTLHAERAQQGESQEKMLGQHKVLLSDLLVASQAADQAIRSVTASQAERRQAKAEESEDLAARSLTGSTAHLSTSTGQLPLAVGSEASNGHGAASSVSGLSRSSFPLGGSPAQKKSGVLWEKVLHLCEERRHLEAYKQVIAEPEESCLLRLMQHTGPIVERLDAESNSRLIRRLIHILSSPTKEPAAHSIEHIFSWLWQALKSGIHFTASQVEDLASALQRVSAPHSPLPAQERAEASQLLARVSALRRS